MNRTIETMVRSMTLDCTDVIPQALWAEVCSMAIHIKDCILHSAFKLKKSLYKIMFGNKPSIMYLYPFGAKCYVHVAEKKQIRTSKLSPKGIKYYVVGYTESSKILRFYNPQKRQVFTSRDVFFPDSTKYLESTKIESLADLPLHLDNDTP
jgi:hypothetical protein